MRVFASSASQLKNILHEVTIQWTPATNAASTNARCTRPRAVPHARPDDRSLREKDHLFACAWLAFAVGFLGVFIPVLPTTPLLLLATFLFANSSPRCHAWICKTKVYGAYVKPFKEQGGIPLKRKAHIIGVSFAVMGISAVLVQKPLVWGILAAVVLFLLWLMGMRIPTISEKKAAGLEE